MADEEKMQKKRRIRIIIKGPKPPSSEQTDPPPVEPFDIKRPRPAAEDDDELNPNKLGNMNICSANYVEIRRIFASLLPRLETQHEKLGKKITRDNLCVVSAMQAQEDPVMSLERMFKNFRCSPSIFIVAYVYIDRLLLKNPNFILTSFNIQRLTLTSVMLASKFLEDLHYNNDYFAKMGGLTLKEMNILEVKLLSMLHYRLQVTVSEFASYCSRFNFELGGGFQFETEGFKKEKGRAASSEAKKGRGTKRASDKVLRLDKIVFKLKKDNRKRRSTYQNTIKYL